MHSYYPLCVWLDQQTNSFWWEVLNKRRIVTLAITFTIIQAYTQTQTHTNTHRRAHRRRRARTHTHTHGAHIDDTDTYTDIHTYKGTRASTRTHGYKQIPTPPNTHTQRLTHQAKLTWLPATQNLTSTRSLGFYGEQNHNMKSCLNPHTFGYGWLHLIGACGIHWSLNHHLKK